MGILSKKEEKIDSLYTKEAIRARDHSLESLEKHVPNPNFTVTELMNEVEKKREQNEKSSS